MTATSTLPYATQNALHKNAPNIRKRLIEAAAHLLMRQSFARMSVAEICALAGSAKGTFYHHFDSKSDLGLAAYDYLWQEMKADLDRCFVAGRTPQAQLKAFADAVVQHQEEIFELEGRIFGCPMMSAGHDMAAQDERIREKIKLIHDTCIGYLDSALSPLAAARGETAAERHAKARDLYACLMGFLYQAKLANSPAILRDEFWPSLKRMLDAFYPSRN